MKKRDIIVILGLLMAVILMILAMFFDLQIMLLAAGLRSLYLDYFFLSIAFATNVFIIFFFLTTLFLWREHKKRWIVPLIFSSILSFLVSFFIKIGIRRPRPFTNAFLSKKGFEALIIAFHFMRDNFNTWNFSFPSFQAVFVFSALPILDKEFKSFRYVWFAFACLVAFSRVYFGVHYLSDVIAGAIIGYLIGYLMVLIEEKYEIGIKVMKRLKAGK